MTFTEFEGEKNVTETIGEQAASLLGPQINRRSSSYLKHHTILLCLRISTIYSASFFVFAFIGFNWSWLTVLRSPQAPPQTR